MIFNTSFLAIQNSHDAAMFCRHQKGGDTSTICINGAITVQGLVDNEADSQQFEFGSIPVRETKIIHILGTALAPNVFGVDYNVGMLVSINGDERWQIQSVIQSADMVAGSEAQTTGEDVPAISNMIDITVFAAGAGE